MTYASTLTSDEEAGMQQDRGRIAGEAASVAEEAQDAWQRRRLA
jgi:hypothetical protein